MGRSIWAATSNYVYAESHSLTRIWHKIVTNSPNLLVVATRHGQSDHLIICILVEHQEHPGI